MYKQPTATLVIRNRQLQTTRGGKATEQKAPSHPSEIEVRQMEVFGQEAGMV